MARYIPDCKFIASIYPGQLDPIRRYYGPSRENAGPNAQRSTLFTLEPVARGQKPFVLPIYDSFESVLNFAGLSSLSNNPQKPRLANPVPVEDIVGDLLLQWTGRLHNIPAGAGPGIMEVKPIQVEIKKWQASNGQDLPGVSGSELNQMTEMQTVYFEYLFTEGERLHAQNNWKEITNTMRLAAEWLGHEREWSHRAIARDSAPCPFCTKIIPNAAIICPNCQQQVKAMPAHLAALSGKTLKPPMEKTT